MLEKLKGGSFLSTLKTTKLDANARVAIAGVDNFNNLLRVFKISDILI